MKTNKINITNQEINYSVVEIATKIDLLINLLKTKNHKRQVKFTYENIASLKSKLNQIEKDILFDAVKKDVLSYQEKTYEKMPSKETYLKKFGRKAFDRIKETYTRKEKVWK